MPDQKIMKDLTLNEMVTVTLPAHVWIGFIGAYASTRWQSGDANEIYNKAADQIFDPVYLKEREAQHSEQHDQAHAAVRAMITGLPPELPPNMEGA